MARYDNILDTIGNTPLVRLNKLAPEGVNLYVKVEAFNPMGSVKDRMAREVIEQAERAGQLKPGQTVIEATSGDEALIVLQQPDLQVDIVLCHVDLPGTMDGFGLARWMRVHKPGLPIILAGSTARAADAASELCESGPMLTKPYDTQILLDRIKRTLAESRR